MVREHNHRLLERARFVGCARTRRGFTLYDLGAFPGLVAVGLGMVNGEVYEVDQETLAALDRLEGHPEFYTRSTISLDDGRRVETYLLAREQVDDCPVIRSGSWRAHRAEWRTA